MLPRSGGYAQKTPLVGIRVAMTKTQRAFVGQVQLPLWANR